MTGCHPLCYPFILDRFESIVRPARLYSMGRTTDAKILETLAVAEQHGINTVFETGGDFVQRYNRQHGGQMQFIPHIEIKTSWSQRDQDDHIKQQVDTGAVALYAWGVSSGPLIRDGQVGVLARAVEMAKKHDLAPRYVNSA